MADLSPGTKPRPRATPDARPNRREDKPRRALSKRRLTNSFGYAFAGIAHVWRNEPNFRIEGVIGVLAVVWALLLNVSPVPILLCCALVLGLELLNSALEALTNLVSPQPHPLAKVAKDAGAGAVLIASLISVLVGLWTLGPPLWRSVVTLAGAG